MHPASPAEVRAFLAQLGPECTYGLRSVDLVRRPVDDAGALCLGELRVPGRVLLFEQPSQPWLLPGRLTPADRDRLVTAGAVVAPQAGGLRTMVHWPGDTLRDFMLWDVLAHEVAHHVQQQYAGKRTARIHRTRDHEALAARLVQRLRSGAGVPSS